MRRSGFEYLIYAVCGALLALPFTFPKLWIIAWIAPVPMLFIEAKRDRAMRHSLLGAYRRGLAFFYPYGIMTFYWFSELYPLEFTGMGKGAALCVVLLGMFGLSLLQALVWAFFFVVGDILIRRIFSENGRKYAILLYPFIWVIFEWVQAQTWAGVPWGKLALGQTSCLPIIQSASLLGPYFVSFIIILTSSLIALASVLLSAKDPKKSLLPICAAVFIFAANVTFGSVRINLLEDQSSENTVRVSVIQGNISSADKWADDSFEYVCKTYARLTKEAADGGAEIVVWPETALPYRLNENKAVSEYVSSLARDTETTILVGAFFRNSDGNLENSIYMIKPDGTISEDHYSKRHLVPFGEYVPMRNIIMTLVPPLNDIGMLDSDLEAGESASVHDTDFGKIASLICFDSIYEPLAYDAVRNGAELIAISTNDSWFNDSSAVYEHNAHSVLRAVENGRYIVRAANTGISSVISPSGEIKDMLPPLVEGQISCDVTFSDKRTLYSEAGNILVPFSVFILAASSVIIRMKGKRTNDGHCC